MYIKVSLLIISLFAIFYILIIRYILYVPTHLYIQNYFNPQNRQIRIYCLILTSPQYFDTRARAVNLTWARRCDKHSFISEYTNDTKGLSIAPIANITPGYWHLTKK